MQRERIFFVLFFAGIAFAALVIMRPFLTYIVLAGILTYILFPIYSFLLRRLGNAGLSSALCVALALVVMILPTVLLVGELVRQMSGAYGAIEDQAVTRIGDYLTGLTGNRLDFREYIASGLDEIRRLIAGMQPDILGSVAELLLGLFIMFFVMFYGFREGIAFVNRLKELLPLDRTLKERLFFEMRTVTQAVLYGQVMTAVIQGSIGGIGLLVFGVSNWLFWGSLMIVTAFLPVLGTPMIWAPASVGLILDGETARGIGLLIFGSTIVMNIDNIIRPRLVSGRAKVHPVLILVGVLGGLKLFGFVGMLIGPLIFALLIALIKFYEEVDVQSRAAGAAD